MSSLNLISFTSPACHAAISEIIHRLSTNRADIRDVALAGLDLSGVRTVLDLGCGFGFMSEKVLPQVTKRALLAGVDACEENRRIFHSLAKKHGHPAEFHCLTLPAPLPWANQSFDLVLASYALYFFVDQLPEIARVISPTGLFLTITHSESSLWNLHEALGLPTCPLPFQMLIRNFSAENGLAKLSPYFRRIEKVQYLNTLRFDVAHWRELARYVEFKWPLMFSGDEVPAHLRETMPEHLQQVLEADGPFLLGKDDAIFRCGESTTA